MSVKNRLKLFIKSQGNTISGFEKDINVSNGYVNSISKGIGGEILLNILEISPNLNINWLLTGKGEMLKSDNKQLNIDNSNISSGIPLLPFDAFAGIGSDVAGVNFDTIEERYTIPLFDGIKIDFMISVKGSSMYPKYNSGDVVACRLVNELLFVQWNKVYVLDTISQGVIIKRLKKSDKEGFIICKSDNESYEPFEIPMDDIRNVALVVGVVRQE